MKTSAINKARADLADASRRLAGMQKSGSFPNLRTEWGEFLSAIRRIYNRLLAGSKGDPFDTEWVKRKLAERDEDPFLNYLRLARNATEYGLDEIIGVQEGLARVRGTVKIGNDWVTDPVITIGGPNATEFFIPPHANFPMELIRPNLCRLSHVESNGKQYEPPLEHLGEAIELLTPVSAARLALNYYESLVAEAAARVV